MDIVKWVEYFVSFGVCWVVSGVGIFLGVVFGIRVYFKGFYIWFVRYKGYDLGFIRRGSVTGVVGVFVVF